MIDANEIGRAALVRLLIEKNVITAKEFEQAVDTEVRSKVDSTVVVEMVVAQVLGVTR